MDFLKRFSSALFAPKDVLLYRHDPWWKALLVFLGLLFILVTPNIVIASQHQGLNYATKLEIRKVFNGDPTIPFRIVNGVLIHNQSDQTYIYEKNIDSNLKIIMTTAENLPREYTASGISIVFRTNGVYLSQSVFSFPLFAYDDYPSLNGINFNDATKLDDIAFWDTIFQVAEQELIKFRPISLALEIVVIIISSIFSLIVISLILAFFQSFQVSTMIRFGELWKLCLYLMAPYAFGNTLAALFNFSLFYYAGFIATTIYAIILGQTILKNNIRRDR